MKIHYKTHYILRTAQGQYLAMAQSAFNLGIKRTLDEAMLACDNYGRKK